MSDFLELKYDQQKGRIVRVDEDGGHLPVPIDEIKSGSIEAEKVEIKNRNLALGEDTSTNREDTTVIGGGAKYNAEAVSDAHEDEAVVIGTDAHANTGWSVTIGAGSESLYDDEHEGDSTVAIGRRAKAKGHSNVAIGRHAEATDTYRATAIGRGAHASGAHSIALGYHWEDAEGATGSDAIAIGLASATSSNTIALGRGSVAKDTAAIAIGMNASSSSNRGIAIGLGSSARDDWSVAIGAGAEASDREGVAIGRGAKTDGGDQSIAIGNDAEADGWRSIALGQGAYTDANGVMIVRLDRNDVFRMDSSGNLKIAGELTEDADL